MRIRLAAAALALAVVSTSATAQSKSADANPWAFGLSAGLRIPSGDASNNVNMGYGGAGHAWYMVNSDFSLRGDVSYDYFGTKVGSGSISFLGGMVNGVYNIQMDGAFKPYVLAGLGMFNGSVSGCGALCPPSETKVGFGGGVGANFAAGGQSLFVELRYMSVQTSGSSTGWIPITLGIRF
ncbi:MAG: outer membrane beta-barrel protein [Gemmatimonadetes bacterium]|nr:outer membrane beta-barrel protein [Gemmatimonadota bacterium]